jgi:hypothetical protein
MHQYIDIIHAVNQELFLIMEIFVFLLLVPFQKLGSLITRHIFRPKVLGFGIRNPIIQILGRVKKCG